jgi:hypothetical protein
LDKATFDRRQFPAFFALYAYLAAGAVISQVVLPIKILFGFLINSYLGNTGLNLDRLFFFSSIFLLRPSILAFL